MILSDNIIEYSNLDVINFSSFEIKYMRPPNNLCENCITLLTRPGEFDELFKNPPKKTLAIIPEGLEDNIKNSGYLS